MKFSTVQRSRMEQGKVFKA